MTLSVAERASVSYFRTSPIRDVQFSDNSDGTGTIKGLKVFRTGTFRDSMGEQHTWEVEHLEQMAFNFRLLRDRDILPNVPVRDNHRELFGNGGRVIGYYDDLRVGEKDEKGRTFLVADVDITEPDDYARIKRGTWRSRSAEIGFYETNDESLFWPVMMGLAWVDLPAVEGLFGKASPTTEAMKFTPIQDAQPEVDEVGDKKDDTTTAPTGQAQHSAPPPTAPPPPPTTPPAPQPSVATFRIGGKEVSDFAAVQGHIDNIEATLFEGQQSAREDFVKQLASTNKIAATQIESMTAHAQALTPEQYETFTKMWEGAPSLSLFDKHGQGDTTDPSPEATEIENLRQRVKFHRQGGMPDEKVKDTQSHKRLMELTNNKG